MERKAEPHVSDRRSMAIRARAAQRLVRSRASRRMEARSEGVSDAKPTPCPWMVVGLGNPGMQYARTRHNVGFLVLDALAQKHGVTRGFDAKSNAFVGRGTVKGVAVLLVQPQTYMNESGKSVRKLADYYKVRPDRILAVYDDIDLELSKLRLRAKGGHGGHNGMRSIIECIGGRKDFPRLKIGIGRPRGGTPVHVHVLQNFLPEEQEEIDVSIMESVGIVESVVSSGLEQAISTMNPTKKVKAAPTAIAAVLPPVTTTKASNETTNIETTGQ